MDPIADLLIRIKNGYQARKDLVVVPHSNIKEQIAKILVEEGYLKKLEVPAKGGFASGGKSSKFKVMELTLKYKSKKPAINNIMLISKPGVRIYRKKGEIPRVRQGRGITLVSTSQGLMTDKKAKKINLGGEVIAQIW